MDAETPKAVELNLPQAFLLLATNDKDGKPEVPVFALRTTVAGSILAELDLIGAIELQGKHVRATDTAPKTDFQHELELIRHKSRPHTPKQWVSMLEGRAEVQRVYEGMASLGIVERVGEKHLGLFRTVRYPEKDHAPEAALRQRIQAALSGVPSHPGVADSTATDARTSDATEPDAETPAPAKPDAAAPAAGTSDATATATGTSDATEPDAKTPAPAKPDAAATATGTSDAAATATGTSDAAATATGTSDATEPDAETPAPAKSDSKAPDVRTSALIALLQASGLLGKLFPAADLTHASELARDYWPSLAVEDELRMIRLAEQEAATL